MLWTKGVSKDLHASKARETSAVDAFRTWGIAEWYRPNWPLDKFAASGRDRNE